MEPISIGIGLLAVEAVKLLGPYLNSIATSAAESIGEDLGASAVNEATSAGGKLWSLLKRSFLNNPAAENELQNYRLKTEDVSARRGLERVLTAELDRSPELAQRVLALVEEATDQSNPSNFTNHIQSVQKLGQFGTVNGDVTF